MWAVMDGPNKYTINRPTGEKSTTLIKITI